MSATLAGRSPNLHALLFLLAEDLTAAWAMQSWKVIHIACERLMLNISWYVHNSNIHKAASCWGKSLSMPLQDMWLLVDMREYSKHHPDRMMDFCSETLSTSILPHVWKAQTWLADLLQDGLAASSYLQCWPTWVQRYRWCIACARAWKWQSRARSAHCRCYPLLGPWNCHGWWSFCQVSLKPSIGHHDNLILQYSPNMCQGPPSLASIVLMQELYCQDSWQQVKYFYHKVTNKAPLESGGKHAFAMHQQKLIWSSPLQCPPWQG